MITLKIKTDKRSEFVDITNDVQKAARENSVSDGIAIIYCPHTTAGITINENADPSVLSDIAQKMSKLIEQDDPAFRHGEGNSDSHIKSSLFGASEMVIIEKGKLVLGRWQGIFFAEFDGPRAREVYITIISGSNI